MVNRLRQWKPPHPDKQEAYALQALAMYANGMRDDPPGPSDVRRALDFIVEKAAGTYEEQFIPGESDAVMYLLGRRSVGLAIVTALSVKPEVFE